LAKVSRIHTAVKELRTTKSVASSTVVSAGDFGAWRGNCKIQSGGNAPGSMPRVGTSCRADLIRRGDFPDRPVQLKCVG
jgi:hypothetical protein